MPNLLPLQEKKNLYARYRGKVIAVSLIFLLMTIVLANLLLIPAYILSVLKLKTAQTELEVLKESVSYIEGEKIEEENQKIHNELAALKARHNPVFLQDYVSALLKSKTSDIYLETIFFKNTDGDNKEISFSGTALTRQSLIDYSEKLESLDQFEEVELPISSLAKDKNLNFSLTAKIVQGR